MCYLFILSEDKMCFNINFQIPKQNKLQIIFADGMKTWSEAIWFFSYVSRLSDTRSRTLCYCSQFYITDKLKILEFWAVARKYNNLNPSPSGFEKQRRVFFYTFWCSVSSSDVKKVTQLKFPGFWLGDRFTF